MASVWRPWPCPLPSFIRDVPTGECTAWALEKGNAAEPVPRDEGMGLSKGFLHLLFQRALCQCISTDWKSQSEIIKTASDS